jgi:hypothetical protein
MIFIDTLIKLSNGNISSIASDASIIAYESIDSSLRTFTPVNRIISKYICIELKDSIQLNEVVELYNSALFFTVDKYKKINSDIRRNLICKLS